MLKIPQILRILTGQQVRKVPFVLLAMLIGAGFEVIGLSLVIPIMDIVANPSQGRFAEIIYDYYPSASSNFLMILAVSMFALVYIIKGVYLTFLVRVGAAFVYGIREDINNRLMQRYLYGPYEFHLTNNSSKIIRNITIETANLVNYALNPILIILTEGIVVMLFAVFLVWVEPQGALIVGAIIFLSALIFQGFIREYISELGRVREHADAKIIQKSQEAIGGIKDIKVLLKEGEFLEQFSKYNGMSAGASLRQFVWGQIPRMYLEAIGVLTLSILLLFLALNPERTSQATETIGLFALAAFRLLPSANRILSALSSLSFSSAVVANLDQQLNSVEPPSVTLIENKKAMSSLSFSGSVDFVDVSYVYPGSDRPSLNGVTLSIRKGETVGIIGKSGAGKTTLVDVFLGLLTPSSGTIFVDGVRIDDNITGWQRLVGYVQQDVFLLDDSIRKNIAFGVLDDEVDDERLSEVVKESQLDELIFSLSEGLDTHLGERGLRLSGGQKQRIGIARALYHQSSVLVLDEATSALDNTTEAEVLSAIENLKGHKTIIVVAHRLSTLKSCDWIVELRNGMILRYFKGSDCQS